ncbi:hypothetical protein NDU88_004299 [Pleurodeles waltl]|uniref:Uncharacterized protein n=1 Tax=Pleurodeles waltl TaxID=8319 RepID=A0AAV7T7K7_PLEWA|nr:hypothetical protein NDU88_004299 [Pleurodeles waltl]
MILIWCDSRFQHFYCGSHVPVSGSRELAAGAALIAEKKSTTASEVKERILQKARRQDVVSFQGAQCALFQDVTQATLLRQLRFRLIMDELIVGNIRYRLRFPFGIAFERNNKPYHFVECGEAVAALGLPETSVDNGFAGQGES